MPLVYSVMADASEKLQAEGRAADEGEAVAIALEEILTFITGEAVAHDTFTVDQAVEMLAKYIAENKDAPAIQNLIGIAAGAIPEEYRDMLKGMLAIYTTNPGEATLEDVLLAFIRAMVYGAEEGSAAYGNEDMRKPSYNRTALYVLVYVLIGQEVPDYPDIIGRDDKGNLNGSGSFTGLSKMILSLLLTTKDAQGNEIVFENASQAADFSLRGALSELAGNIRTLMEQAGISEDVIGRELDGRVAVLLSNVTSVRKLIFDAFVDTPGAPYSIAKGVGNITTLITNVSLYPTEHYNVMYTSWAKAGDQNDVNDHYITHVEETPATCTEEGTRQHWVYTDANGEISYTDRYLTEVMTDKDMIIPAMGHEWGEWETVREATADSEGLEKRVCKHDPNHVEERNTPKTDPVPGGGDTPSDPATPDAPSDPSGGDKQVQPSAADRKSSGNTSGSESRTVPGTGDSNYTALWIFAGVGAAAAAGAAVAGVYRSRKKDN